METDETNIPEVKAEVVPLSPVSDELEIRVRAKIRRSRMDEASDGRILRVIEDVQFMEADLWGYDPESQEVYDPAGVEWVLAPGVVSSIPNIVRFYLQVSTKKGG